MMKPEPKPTRGSSSVRNCVSPSRALALPSFERASMETTAGRTFLTMSRYEGSSLGTAGALTFCPLTGWTYRAQCPTEAPTPPTTRQTTTSKRRFIGSDLLREQDGGHRSGQDI